MSNDSILVSIKKLLGIAEDDTSFDPDITMYINSALFSLTQIGIGPAEGFVIESALETWDDLINVKVINESVRSFVYVKVRLIFDPPASQTIIAAYNAAASEYEWRIKQWLERIE